MNESEMYYQMGYRVGIMNVNNICSKAISDFYHTERENGNNDDYSRGMRDGLVLAGERVIAALKILRAEKKREWDEAND